MCSAGGVRFSSHCFSGDSEAVSHDASGTGMGENGMLQQSEERPVSHLRGSGTADFSTAELQAIPAKTETTYDIVLARDRGPFAALLRHEQA